MPTASEPRRRLDIDHLRALAVLLLVPFHTARLFDREPWHVKHAETYPAADTLVGLMNPWHMPLLFLLAGMGGVLALRTRPVGGFLRERVRRLFLPLLVGIPVFVFPQVYLERTAHGMAGRMSPIDADGGPVDFLPQFFTCCYPAANFSYHHLWFLWYLFAYSVLLAPLLSRMARRHAAGAWSGWGVAVLGLPVVLAEVALRPLFPSTHAFIDDWANHTHFLTLILLGALIATDPALEDRIGERRRVWILGALLLTGLWVLSWGQALTADPDTGRRLARGLRAAGEWFWLLAFLGYGRLWLDRRLPFLTDFARVAVVFYLVHQTVIVALGWLWAGWEGWPLAKSVTIVLVATVVSLGLCRLLDAGGWTRLLVGLKPVR